MKYIGIVGSRRRDGLEAFRTIAESFYMLYNPGDVIVSGGCKQGGDRFAEILAKILHIDPIIYLPQSGELDLPLLTKNPRAAYAKINYARNTLIAQKSDQLIACVAPDRKGGTEDTIKKFEKFHIGRRAILV